MLENGSPRFQFFKDPLMVNEQKITSEVQVGLAHNGSVSLSTKKSKNAFHMKAPLNIYFI